MISDPFFDTTLYPSSQSEFDISSAAASIGQRAKDIVERALKSRFPTRRQDTLPKSFTTEQKMSVILREELPIQGGLISGGVAAGIGKVKQLFGGDDIYSIPIHGRWTGPLFSGNRRMAKGDLLTPEDLEVAPTDDLDSISRSHDVMYALAATEKDPEKRTAAYRLADKIYVDKVDNMRTNYFMLTFDSLMTAINIYSTISSVIDMYNTMKLINATSNQTLTQQKKTELLVNEIKKREDKIATFKEKSEREITDMVMRVAAGTADVREMESSIIEINSAIRTIYNEHINTIKDIDSLNIDVKDLTGAIQRAEGDYKSVVEVYNKFVDEIWASSDQLEALLKDPRIEKVKFTHKPIIEGILTEEMTLPEAGAKLMIANTQFGPGRPLQIKGEVNNIIAEITNLQDTLQRLEGNILNAGDEISSLLEYKQEIISEITGKKELAKELTKQMGTLGLEFERPLTIERDTLRRNLRIQQEELNYLNTTMRRNYETGQLELKRMKNEYIDRYVEAGLSIDEMERLSNELLKQKVELQQKIPSTVASTSGVVSGIVSSLTASIAASLFAKRLETGDEKYFVYQETPEELRQKYIEKLISFGDQNYVEKYQTAGEFIPGPGIGFVQPSLEDSIYSRPIVPPPPPTIVEQPSIQESIYEAPTIPLDPLPELLRISGIPREVLLAALEILL